MNWRKIITVFSILELLLWSCESNANQKRLNQTNASKHSNTSIKNPNDSITSSHRKTQWRNPALLPLGVDISRVIRGYYLAGDYNKMLQFVIIPPCYEKKQIENILRKSKWGYNINMTSLQWMEDGTFVLTYKTSKFGTTGSEQYVGKICNDTAKIFLFPEKENLFQYFGDEDLKNPCPSK